MDSLNWIERKSDWLPVRAHQARESPEEVFTIAEVAHFLKVDRETVYKWLSKDASDMAGIPLNGWFKLPGGDIRIRKWAVERLMG